MIVDNYKIIYIYKYLIKMLNLFSRNKNYSRFEFLIFDFY